MPRYYFHVWSGGQLTADEAGYVFPSLDAARRNAEALAARIVSQSASESGDRSCWDIEVTDNAGRTVLLQPVGDVRQNATKQRAA